MTNFKCNVYPYKYECQENAVGDFGTKNDFYESENYKGDGCAHDVKR